MANEKRLIDANAEIRKLKDVLAEMNAGERSFAVATIINGLERAPTIDAVEVVHGRWVEAGFDGHGDYKECCSNCATWSVGDDKLYCPCCGAKMDGDENG